MDQSQLINEGAELEVCQENIKVKEAAVTIADLYSLPNKKEVPNVIKKACRFILEQQVEVSHVNIVHTKHGLVRDKGHRGTLRKNGARFGPNSAEQDKMLMMRFNIMIEKGVVEDKLEFCKILKLYRSEQYRNIDSGVTNIVGLFVGQDLPFKLAALHCSRLTKLVLRGTDSHSVPTNSQPQVSISLQKPKVILSFVSTPTDKELAGIVMRLGGMLTDNPTDCSHLVMGKLARTDKLLMCLPVVKHVLRTTWITDSDEAGRWISEEGYLLEDPEVERKFNFNMSSTLSRSNRDKLFMGKTFYMTPNVRPNLQVMKSIIKFSGGRLDNITPACKDFILTAIFRLKNKKMKTTQEMKEINSGGNMNYIILTCEEDLHLVTDVLRAEQPVFPSELVMSAITRCELDWDVRNYFTYS